MTDHFRDICENVKFYRNLRNATSAPYTCWNMIREHGLLSSWLCRAAAIQPPHSNKRMRHALIRVGLRSPPLPAVRRPLRPTVRGGGCIGRAASVYRERCRSVAPLRRRRRCFISCCEWIVNKQRPTSIGVVSAIPILDRYHWYRPDTDTEYWYRSKPSYGSYPLVPYELLTRKLAGTESKIGVNVSQSTE